MFGFSLFEIIFLAALALIVIGPKELPEVARTIGRFLNELKRSTSVLSDDLKQQARIDFNLHDTPQKPKVTKAAAGATTSTSPAASTSEEVSSPTFPISSEAPKTASSAVETPTTGQQMEFPLHENDGKNKPS